MNVQELIQLLPASLHDDPESARVLAAMLEPLATVQTYQEVRRDKLPTLLDPEACPDELVPYLAALVGVGRDLEAAATASVADLRKLIPVAIDLWKRKGARPSWRDVVASVAGSRTVILDWFELRTIHGSPSRVHVIPSPGGSGFPYSTPEFVSDVWYMDPASAVDQDLVGRFLDVVRPSGEWINLYAVSLVDDLGAGAGLWEGGGLGSWSYDAEARELATAGGYEFVTDLDGLESSWTDYHATLRLAVTNDVVIRFYYQDDDNHYRIELDQVAGTASLVRVIGGTPVVLATSAAVTMITAFPYLWAVEAWEGGAGTTIRLYWQGVKLIDHYDTTGGRPTSGPLAWGGTASASAAVLSTALIWPSGTTPTRIGPNP